MRLRQAAVCGSSAGLCLQTCRNMAQRPIQFQPPREQRGHRFFQVCRHVGTVIPYAKYGKAIHPHIHIYIYMYLQGDCVHLIYHIGFRTSSQHDLHPIICDLDEALHMVGHPVSASLIVRSGAPRMALNLANPFTFLRHYVSDQTRPSHSQPRCIHRCMSICVREASSYMRSHQFIFISIG